jgi:hypothetical protein
VPFSFGADWDSFGVAKTAEVRFKCPEKCATARTECQCLRSVFRPQSETHPFAHAGIRW